MNNRSNLPFTLTLKVGQLYDVTANLAVSDGIISGGEWHIKFIEYNSHNLKFFQCVWVQFTDPAIGKECQCKYKCLHSQFVAHQWTPIQSIQWSFIVKQNQTVTHTQFPLCLASAHSIHVAQSSTYTKIFVDMSNEKSTPKQWWEHMHYVAFSCCTSLQGLHIMDINETAIPVSQKVKNYPSHEKEEMQLCYMPTYNMCNHIVLTYNNVGSLHHKWKAIQNNHNIQGSHVIFLAETWL